MVQLVLFSLKSDSLEHESIGSGFESQVGHSKRTSHLRSSFWLKKTKHISKLWREADSLVHN